MSSLKYMHSNLSWSRMIKIICYNTQNLHKLSKKQQITRLYKNVLRFNYAQNMPSTGLGVRLYKEQTTLFKNDFEKMLNSSTDSNEFIMLKNKYEKWMAENYEPLMLNDASQPYGVNSNKIWIWSDEQIMYDPHGYYNPKNINYRVKEHGVPFFEDFPVNDTEWRLNDDVWAIDERA